MPSQSLAFDGLSGYPNNSRLEKLQLLALAFFIIPWTNATIGWMSQNPNVVCSRAPQVGMLAFELLSLEHTTMLGPSCNEQGLLQSLALTCLDLDHIDNEKTMRTFPETSNFTSLMPACLGQQAMAWMLLCRTWFQFSVQNYRIWQYWFFWKLASRIHTNKRWQDDDIDCSGRFPSKLGVLACLTSFFLAGNSDPPEEFGC